MQSCPFNCHDVQFKSFILIITDQVNAFQPNAPVEEENEQLTDGLKDKIGALRTVNYI
jgi:hypothetical protein